MPPGISFAGYDSKTGNPDYIPPEYCDIPQLIDELVDYVNTTDDHPLIVAAVVHYQMGLPALYYSGRENPPHPEIWVDYFLRMVQLYSSKVCDLQHSSNEDDITGSISYLKGKEKELLLLLIRKYKREFTPIEVSKEVSVTNKTIINRLAVLVKSGFVVPILVNQRIMSYQLSDFTKKNEKAIVKAIK